MDPRDPLTPQAGAQKQIDRLKDWVQRNKPTGAEAADITRRIALLSSEIAALRGVHRP
ncbi:hypothetical protein [Parafrankia soli]|uniref:hypothetical protein n=1 Tax=Parafrankia soli TaxID=2599596 RepID=UPI0012FF923F|nr:hypothetical protein [Parafrankia soli]